MSLTEEDLIFIEDFRKEAKAAIRDVSPSWKQWSTNLLEDVKVRFLQQRASLLEEVASLKEQRLVLDNRRKTVEQQIKDVRRNLQAMGARDEVKRRKIDTQEVRRATPIGYITKKCTNYL
jgi:septal ring factor EnvC (AmiA/AmiB activator)